MIEIVIEVQAAGAGNFYASFAGIPDMTGCGAHPESAIGALIKSHGSVHGITVVGLPVVTPKARDEEEDPSDFLLRGKIGCT